MQTNLKMSTWHGIDWENDYDGGGKGLGDKIVTPMLMLSDEEFDSVEKEHMKGHARRQ